METFLMLSGPLSIWTQLVALYLSSVSPIFLKQEKNIKFEKITIQYCNRLLPLYQHLAATVKVRVFTISIFKETDYH